MKVIVKYFAIYKEMTGVREEAFEVERGKSINELLGIIIKKYNFKNQDNMVVSLNHEYIKTDVKLKDGDEVAIMMPSSGG